MKVPRNHKKYMLGSDFYINAKLVKKNEKHTNLLREVFALLRDELSSEKSYPPISKNFLGCEESLKALFEGILPEFPKKKAAKATLPYHFEPDTVKTIFNYMSDKVGASWFKLRA